ncbi:MAG: DUF4236 domain-containing protein, partial [Christensenellales bacterium]
MKIYKGVSMGWRFRKSINLGGFRINFSKTGIGYSFGDAGLRYTKKANGGNRITSSIRGTGISYSKDWSNSKKKSNNSNNYNPQEISNIQNEENKIESNLVQSKQNELVDKLNDAYTQNRKNKTKKIWIGIGAFLSFCYLTESALALIPFIGLIVWFCLLPKKISIDLDYDFSENKDKEQKYNNLLNGLDELMSNGKLCEITAVSANCDYKNQAGARSLLSTSANVKIGKKVDYIDTDLELKTLKIQNKEIMFLPDIILVCQDKIWKSIEYSDIEVMYQNSRFIETGIVPSD